MGMRRAEYPPAELAWRHQQKLAGWHVARRLQEVRDCSPTTRTEWRRERDSNPRYPFGYSGFQDRPFRPLTHPSV